MVMPWAGGVLEGPREGEKWAPFFGMREIDAAFTGAGTLTTRLSGYRKITATFSGTGTLTTRLGGYRKITADFSGTGTLDSRLSGLIEIDAAFGGEGTFEASIRPPIECPFGGEGTFGATLLVPKRISADFDSEGVLLTELVYTPRPTPLDRSPLGRLVGYSVSTTAVPVNPAEGSGSVPSVSPSYIAGTDPEYVLGQEVEVKNNAVGTYRGEAVRVSLSKGSDVVALSTNTLVTSANTELHLSPFIDSSPGKWTAARALDYWTQQAGVFYDDVPGDCVFYASGYGHTLAYAGDTDGKRCFEKTTGSTVTVVLSGRSVRNLGDDVTGTTAFHDDPEARVPLVLPSNRQLAFSVGLALRGTGRTSAVSWNLRDAINRPHTLKLQVTSAGAVTVTLNTLTLATATVNADGNYRFTLSLARASATAISAKLTVHTDNLAGSGTLVHNGAPVARSYRLPGVMNLASVGHTSTGSSGAAMLRWGTYLAMVKSHPMALPAVQKVFDQTSRDYSFVSGFTGNVWSLLNEFCSIARLDVRFNDGQLVISPRSSSVVAGTKDSRLSVDAQRREKFKQVAVVNKQSKAVATETAVLWRSDSVYQLNTREVFETTVQTPHSILSVRNPVPVPGISPYPYTTGGGQYVVTGADGYIIAPQWWIDNGGKIEASLTEKQGEIALKITAPDVDSDVRAPYRISEGAADRPALYISGAGIINDPKELHIGTGATKAREGFESVFESPFIAGPREAFDVANRMAHEYSAAVADVDYELPNDFDTPTAFGQYPAGAVFTDNTRNYRLSEVTQTPSKVSARAIPHTTIGAYKSSYPAGATIADEKSRHRGRTIREFNIKPLRSQS
jgi:hypothetical protein